MRALAYVMGFVLMLGGLVPAHARPPAPVEVQKLERRTVARGHKFVGTIRPSRRSRVSVEVAGFVLTRPVKLGQRVATDTVVATLRTDVVDKQIAVAEARIAQEIAALRELQNGFRVEEKREAEAAVERASATVELARWKVTSAQRLFDDGRKITEDALRDAKLALVVAQRLLDQAKARHDLLQAGPRDEAIAQACARVAVAKAELDRWTLVKTQHVAKAPFTGYVVAEHTEVGEWVSEGDPVVELVDLDAVDVVVPVLEDFVGALKVGQEITVIVPSLGDRPFEGKIVGIVPEAKERARTMPVRVRLKNVIEDGAPLLKSGMFATVTLAVGAPHEALMAPKDALKLGGARPEIFVVDPKTRRASPIQVGLGVADGAWIEVRGPLEAGQIVVTKGNERLQPGAVVALPE